ncbi:hypothetical protein [Paramicrobacterium chengjingii]|uniref:Uncharacterized protein n=1 Tax=Paramicrobacterium chengjingii TaxID=2769067 RepID=A0ABX6YLP1_9MICO|nr:hypothetical protein [Microbacterium chengjingii]QPZ39733.1 hypothetical protein HCR76_06720 [Microbacterium chengjingii]
MSTQNRALARVDDPETSWDAANEVNLSEVQHRIGVILEEHTSSYIYGMTDEEISQAYRSLYGFDATDQSLRSRRAELVKLQKVVFTGFYGKTILGNRTRRWALAGSEDES